MRGMGSLSMRLKGSTIRAFYESEEGKREFAEWNAKRDAEKNMQSG